MASIIAIQQDIFDSFVEQKIIDELLKYYKDKNVIVARKEGLPRGIDFKPNDWGVSLSGWCPSQRMGDGVRCMLELHLARSIAGHSLQS